MARQISMESALAACQARLGELTYENVLLRAQVKDAEAEIEQLRQQGGPSAGPPAETA